jgi:hypothetical protein
LHVDHNLLVEGISQNFCRRIHLLTLAHTTVAMAAEGTTTAPPDREAQGTTLLASSATKAMLPLLPLSEAISAIQEVLVVATKLAILLLLLATSTGATNGNSSEL